MIKTVRAAVEAIDEDAWQTIDYPDDGEAQIAETIYGGRRLIVRRTRLLGAQAELWPDWRHFAFITNRTDDIALVEAEHRDHAVVEQVIADLKDQALAHFPSGHFNANGAWTVLAALAHNLLRWTQLLGLPDTTVRAARTLRRRLLAHPRPPDPPRARLDAAPARPLALARRLHQRAQPHPRAARRRLTRPTPSPTTSSALPPTRARSPLPSNRHNASAAASTARRAPDHPSADARLHRRRRRHPHLTTRSRSIGGSGLSLVSLGTVHELPAGAERAKHLCAEEDAGHRERPG